MLLTFPIIGFQWQLFILSMAPPTQDSIVFAWLLIAMVVCLQVLSSSKTRDIIKFHSFFPILILFK